MIKDRKNKTTENTVNLLFSLKVWGFSVFARKTSDAMSPNRMKVCTIAGREKSMRNRFFIAPKLNSMNLE